MEQTMSLTVTQKGSLRFCLFLVGCAALLGDLNRCFNGKLNECGVEFISKCHWMERPMITIMDLSVVVKVE